MVHHERDRGSKNRSSGSASWTRWKSESRVQRLDAESTAATAISISVRATSWPSSRKRPAVAPTLCHWTGPRSAHGRPVNTIQRCALSAGRAPASSSATTGPHTTTSPATRRSSSRPASDALPRRRYSIQTEVSTRTVTLCGQPHAAVPRRRRSPSSQRVAGVDRRRRASGRSAAPAEWLRSSMRRAGVP